MDILEEIVMLDDIDDSVDKVVVKNVPGYIAYNTQLSSRHIGAHPTSRACVRARSTGSIKSAGDGL